MNDFTTIAAGEMYEDGRRAGFRHIAVYPVLEFLKVYIIKRGFLDGLAGIVVAVFHSFYVCLKYSKLRELALYGSRTVAGHPESSRAARSGGGEEGR